MLRVILRRVACFAIALGIGVLFMPSSANANMRLELAQTSPSLVGTVLTDIPNTGILSFNGTIGVFGVNVTTGTSAPPLAPPPGEYVDLDLNSINISTPNAGSMTIILEYAGYTLPAGNYLAKGDIGGTISNGTVTASGWVGTTNVVPTLPADQGVGAIGAPPAVPAAGGVQELGLTTSSSSFSYSQSVVFTNTGTFSLYKELVVTFGAGGGIFSADFSDSVEVPEPSSMVIAGLGALGMIGYGLRRRKAMGV